MKIILLEDVEKVGEAGDIKEVSDGYARNFLFPQKLAELATAENIQKIEAEKIRQAKVAEQDLIFTEKIADQLNGTEIELAAKVNEAGKLYAGVQKKEIIEALRELKFPVPENLDDKMIELSEHIKTLGEHTAKIIFAPNEEIILKVEVRKLD